MKKACKAAAASLESGSCPLLAVQAAITVMEDDPLANAGTGSNLNIDGHVECDASVMSDDGTFGAIGAAPGIRNPVAAACRLALDSREPLSHGRVRPVMLAGDAVRKWAIRCGIDAAPTSSAATEMHVTKKARKQYERYMEIINDGAQPFPFPSPSPDNTDSDSDHPEPHTSKRRRVDPGSDQLYDTVGCCVVDCSGHVAAGVSSGGIALKTSGRIGEAAVYGAGCWSQQFSGVDRRVGVSVTGVGERIMQHLVSREVGTQVGSKAQGDGDVAELCENIIKNTVGSGPLPKECGVLCAVASRGDSQVEVQLAAVHCESKSMAVAWLWQDEHGKRRSESRILRRSAAANGGGDISQRMAVGVHWPIPC